MVWERGSEKEHSGVVFTVHMNRRRVLALAGALAAGAAFGRSDSLALPNINLGLSLFTARAESSIYFPPTIGDEWEAIPPGAVGWNETALEDALRYANEQNSTAVMLLYKGRILVERYWGGWEAGRAANIFSAGKSVVAILTGIAQEAGLLHLDDSVTMHLGPGWSRASAEQEEHITVRHLLTMTSGLDDALRHVAEPGTVWFYNTPAYYHLQEVVAAAASKSYDTYAREVLFGKVGMGRSRWQNYQMVSSVRDMARFGLLMLNDGFWNGADVVRDKTYLADATKSSQSLNPSYGYLWWLNGKDGHIYPGRQGSGAGSLVPNAPNDMVAALGAGDKKIYLVPSLDLVIVRHGMASEDLRAQAASRFDNLWWQKLSAAAPIPPTYADQRMNPMEPK